jgi:hypothetical protein
MNCISHRSPRGVVFFLFFALSLFYAVSAAGQTSDEPYPGNVNITLPKTRYDSYELYDHAGKGGILALADYRFMRYTPVSIQVQTQHKKQ